MTVASTSLCQPPSRSQGGSHSGKPVSEHAAALRASEIKNEDEFWMLCCCLLHNVVAACLHQLHQGLVFTQYIKSMFASAPANHQCVYFYLLLCFSWSSGGRGRYHQLSL